MFGPFINPGYLDLGDIFRGTAAPTTNNQAAPNAVTIDGVTYLVTGDTQAAIYQLRVKQRERELARPLTTAEKAAIAGALRALVTAGQKNLPPTVNPVSGANIAPDPRTDPHGVMIDGKYYIVTRDNIAELTALRIKQLERQAGKPIAEADKRAVAQALTNLATDAGPQDANPSVSTFQIALEGIKRAAAKIDNLITGPVDPNTPTGHVLDILTVAGYAAMLWAAAQLLRKG